MSNAVRISCGALALLISGLIIRQGVLQAVARADWKAGLPHDRVSELAPLRTSIADLYAKPPPPCRRVRLAGAYRVRDVMPAGRPVTLDGAALGEGPVHVLPEGLVFLEDSLTGQRLVMLTRLDRDPPEWLELMPLPADISRKSAVRRWTPLAHLTSTWHPGWAQSNGRGQLVWLGLDSAVVRYRDMLSFDPPYRLSRHIVAGRPGGPPEPAPWTATMSMMGIMVLVLALVIASEARWHGGPAPGKE